jgi:uncharacterized YccA/Bax inhibitor family protein
MNSNNPFFKNKTFTNPDSEVVHETTVIGVNETMTVSGTINKSFLMLILLIASASVTWIMTFNGQNPMVMTIGGALVGFILVLIATFRPQNSGFLAPGYAIFEGLFIGGISAIFEVMYPGMVIQAVSCTFVTFMVCFGLYKYEIVKVNDKFRSVVIAATLAIGTYYLISWLLSMFTSFQPVHYGNSMISIGISAIVIVVAALNLFLDFDQIEKGVQKKMPKYMEWYSAMGLMITLVWLYIEFLRLLSKLQKK